MIIRYLKSLILTLSMLLCLYVACTWRPFLQTTHHQVFHLQTFKSSETFKYFLLLKNADFTPISNDKDVVGPYRSLYEAYQAMQNETTHAKSSPHYLPIERA